MIGTRRGLQRFWVGLLALTALTLAGAVIGADLGRRDANALRATLAPAREGVAAAEESMMAADTESVREFAALLEAAESGRTADPGVRYREAVAAAGRQLTQVSQADISGPAAESVQVVSGLLTTYDGLVYQAFRSGADILAQAKMQYAHNFMAGEILPQLDTLRENVYQDSPQPPPAWRHLLWALPLVALAALLAWAQVWLSRRFRRTLSAPLLAASVLVVALGVTATASLGVDDDVAEGRSLLTTLVADYETGTRIQRANGCEALADVSRDWPSPVSGNCGEATGGTSTRTLLSMANSVSTTAQDASRNAVGATTTAVVLAVLLGLAISAGLLPRLEEYRVRRR